MRFVCLLLVLAGCSSTRNPKTCLEGLCPDPAFPFCDADGSLAGEPNACIAVECEPSEFVECRGDQALTCNPTGDNYSQVECEFGCGPSGCVACDSPECEKRIIPKYVAGPCSTLATEALTISADTMLDTSQNQSCSAVIAQPTGPEICVLRYSEIKLDRNKTLTVVGTRALALVADRDVLIDGIVDGSATRSTNTSGPGGGQFVSGQAAAGTAGGGAGYRHDGGDGGTTTTGGAANGGDARTGPVGVSELFGGARSTQNLRNGGGAISVVSCRGTVSVPGTIDVGGGGGDGGETIPPTTYLPPTGGGAGGTIVLQGMRVDVTGELYANGGSGGGGGVPLNGSYAGRDALASTMAVSGGGNGAGQGGSGGTTSQPGAGVAGGTNGSASGAGGGSAGFIVIYVPIATASTGTPLAVSPIIESTQIIPTN